MPGLKSILFSALLLMAGKSGWMLFWGPQLEADSLGYFELQIDFLHPPLYNVWVWLGMKAGGIWLVLLSQAAALSVGLAALIEAMEFRKEWKWATLALLALDPCSGYLCASLMSEALFLALLTGWIAFVLKAAPHQPFRNALLAGAGAGLIWLCRYTGVLLLPLFAVWAWRQRQSLRQWAVALLVFFAGFQVMLLPLRAYYFQQWGVVTLNSFTALSTWNNASFLAPDYFKSHSPANEMEDWVASFPDSVYSLRSTFLTAGIHSSEMPWQRYVATHRPDTRQAQDCAGQLGGLGRKLTFAYPLRWFREFVVPNFFKPLHESEPKIEVQHPMQSVRRGHYYVLAWQLGLSLLVAGTLLLFIRAARSPAAMLLLGFCWLHLAAVTLGAVFFLRYAYLMIPLILLAGSQLAWRWVSIRPERRA